MFLKWNFRNSVFLKWNFRNSVFLKNSVKNDYSLFRETTRMSEEKGMESIFQKKYTEFCDDLLGTYPEKDAEIRAARALTETERMERFRAEVLPTAGTPTRNTLVCPGVVLPGVVIGEEDWKTISSGSQKAIQEYLTLLASHACFPMESIPGLTWSPILLRRNGWRT